MARSAEDPDDRRLRRAAVRERTRLANALHDGPLQDLAAMLLEAKDSTADPAPRAGAFRDGLERVSAELRALTGSLHEPSLDELSLREAIDHVLRPLVLRGGPEITVDITAGADVYNDPMVRESVRELLVNVAQHAAARRVTVVAELVHDRLRISVTDDGAGFDAAAAARAGAEGHVGLQRLRRSTANLGGTFRIRSTEPQGTEATVELPVSALEARVPSPRP